MMTFLLLLALIIIHNKEFIKKVRKVITILYILSVNVGRVMFGFSFLLGNVEVCWVIVSHQFRFNNFF